MNCHVCNSENTVNKKQVNKYGSAARLVGYIIALPNFFVLVTLFASWVAGSTATGDAASSALIGGIGIMIFFPMFLMMLFGFALLGKKKALVCGNCGYKMEAE